MKSNRDNDLEALSMSFRSLEITVVIRLAVAQLTVLIVASNLIDLWISRMVWVLIVVRNGRMIVSARVPFAYPFKLLRYNKPFAGAYAHALIENPP